MNKGSNNQWSVAAEQLRAVRLNASVIDQIPEAHRPATIDQAYALQDTLNQSLALDLGEPVGYKIGCTTEVMQKYLKIPHPCSGRIFKSTAGHGRLEFSAGKLCRPGVECEIAVQLKKDMPDEHPYAAKDCAAFVEGVLPSIELVDDRWVDYQSVDVHSLVAENFFGAGCVTGDPRPVAFDALSETRGQLWINEQLIGAGRGRDILGHPFEALAWLANHQVRRDEPLRAGDIVSLGSVVRTYWLTVGDRVKIEFDGLGSCALTLSE